MQLLKDRHARSVATDRLAVNHRRCCLRRCHGLADAWIAVAPVEPVAREQTQPAVPFAGDETRVGMQGSMMPGRLMRGLARAALATGAGQLALLGGAGRHCRGSGAVVAPAEAPSVS
jgi:hypothetical protein